MTNVKMTVLAVSVAVVATAVVGPLVTNPVGMPGVVKMTGTAVEKVMRSVNRFRERMAKRA
jgi:hypothetical protein